MNSFETHLRAKLKEVDEAGLLRTLRRVESPQDVRIRVDGSELLNFSSNDYLGLANHPALREASIRAVERHGAGSGASRLISGSLSIHAELEERLADFKGAPAALTFSSGYNTAIGTICSLVARDDIVVLDKRVHACIVDAARLSGAKLRVFRHNDLNDLERILKWADTRADRGPVKPRVLVVTESVFSMNGDLAPLKPLVELKTRYGAWLMLDEAHATGVFGPHGSGRARQADVADRIEIQMGTLGKALGAAGGYICGSRELVDHLINRARPFIFSTAPVPAAAAAAAAGVEVARSPEGDARRETLWKRVPDLARILARLGDASIPAHSPILPWILGEESRAVEVSDRLRSAGVHAPAIRFPTVGRGRARLRFTLTADHSERDLAQLAAALSQVVDPPSSIEHAPARAS